MGPTFIGCKVFQHAGFPTLWLGCFATIGRHAGNIATQGAHSGCCFACAALKGPRMHTRSAVLSCDSCNFYCDFLPTLLGDLPPLLNHHSFIWPCSRHLGKALVTNTSSEANLRVHPWLSTKGKKNRQYTIHTGILTGILTIFHIMFQLFIKQSLYLSSLCI